MSIISTLKHRAGLFIKRLTFSPLHYWEERAQKYGERSVLNIGLSEEESRSVKELQLKEIFPLLKQQMNGTEKTLLDFGCGPGRLSIELADATGCKVTAADPIRRLLDLAPSHPSVSYIQTGEHTISAPDKAFDIIWISFVLGGIVSKKNMSRTVGEMNRVANDNCLLFLVENTSDTPDTLYWKYRPVNYYRDLFPDFKLIHLGDFNHGNERFAMLSGRKVVN